MKIKFHMYSNIIMSVFIFSACGVERDHKNDSRRNDGVGQESGFEVASDSFCINDEIVISDKVSDERLLRLYDHFRVCKNDNIESKVVLDLLIERNNPEAKYKRAIELYTDGNIHNNQKIGLLLKEAGDGGYSPAVTAYREWVRTGAF